MQLIDAFDDNPNQKHTVLLDENDQLILTFKYDDQNSGWFVDIYYAQKEFTLNNFRLTTGLNILRQYDRVIPFGIMVTCDDSQEPLFIQDFLSGRAALYVLNADEVANVEAYYAGAL
jgi:hypothetical protein